MSLTPAEHQRNTRARRLAKGLCPQCGQRAPQRGNITCDWCLEQHYRKRQGLPRQRLRVLPSPSRLVPSTPIEAKVYYAPKGSLALAILGRDRAWNTR